MLVDYKFWYVTKADDVHISECAVKFREGAIQEVALEEGGTEERYVKSKTLTEKDLAHLGKGFKKNLSGENCKVYTAKDFGVITELDELRVFLNGELKKDKERTPVDVQNTLDISKVK